jgi:hypothetical protein
MKKPLKRKRNITFSYNEKYIYKKTTAVVYNACITNILKCYWEQHMQASKNVKYIS